MTEVTARTKKVAVVGFGNIGSGVVDILDQKGVPGLELCLVVDKDLDRERSVTIPESLASLFDQVPISFNIPWKSCFSTIFPPP